MRVTLESDLFFAVVSLKTTKMSVKDVGYR